VEPSRVKVRGLAVPLEKAGGQPFRRTSRRRRRRGNNRDIRTKVRGDDWAWNDKKDQIWEKGSEAFGEDGVGTDGARTTAKDKARIGKRGDCFPRGLRAVEWCATRTGRRPGTRSESSSFRAG